MLLILHVVIILSEYGRHEVLQHNLPGPERISGGTARETFIARTVRMATKLELEEYLYRRAIDIIESADSDSEKEKLLFQEVWLPLANLYRDTVSSGDSN